MTETSGDEWLTHPFPAGVGSVLVVHLNRLQANAEAVRSMIGARFFWAVVKADGYGVGALAVSRAFLAGGADGLAVARLEEYQALRDAGIAAPILILGPLPRVWPEDDQLHLTVSSASELQRVLSIDSVAPLHLKVDSGMGRLGLHPDLGWVSTATVLQERWFGLWSHYSHSDTPAAAENMAQIQRMQHTIETVKNAGISPVQIHMANSGGLAQLQSWENAVRIGLYLYGANPWEEAVEAPLPGAALEWTAPLVGTRTVPENWGLSYRSMHHTTTETPVGVLPVGYADGLPAVPADTIYVTDGTHDFPIRGRITMDLAVVECGESMQDGHRVYLLGPLDASKNRTINMLATACGRIPYEVLTAIGPRVQRRYVGGTE